ncbi:E3 ubiquitin-protein ligase RLIM [Cajanus cajan]|uniref:E3 ubiquitin-protein ligase RLIM n=1 Tax=Cajanus cajan TaxID=3821 RepID=UPI00098D86AA|nr:E3 ubiquitin-protein ligase RLIM [Cajanus cajan]
MAEDMKIDHVVEVPDTPDRITVRCDDQKYLGNPETRGRAFNVADEMNNHNNYIMSPSKESYSSQNAPIFRRAQTGKIIGLGAAHSDGAEKMEKGKTISSKFPSKPSHCRPISILDLSEENGQFQQLKPAFSNRGSRDKATEDKKAVNTDSSNTSRNAFTGKCKLDNKTLPGPNISVDRGKSISLYNDSQSQIEKQVPLPPRVSTTPRGRGHKRLVRNGCISPHNIATREKQLAEQSNHQTKDVEQSHALHSVSSNAVSPIGVNDIVSGERGSGRVKGKEVLAHPASHGHNIETLRAPSGLVINNEEINRISKTIRHSRQYSGGQSGWRTTHNERNADQNLYDVNGHHLRRNNDLGRFSNRQNTNRMDRRNTGSGQSSKHVHGSLSNHASQQTSVIIPDVDLSSGTRHTNEILTKRQRKRESPLGNPNEESYSSDIMFLGSSGESSSSSWSPVLDPEVVELLSAPMPRGSSSSQSPVLDPEVVELLSTPRHTNRLSEGLDDNDNNSSEARARQVEADEILARELQEQLYHDDSFEGRGIDEHLAWEMQHAENLLRTSIDIHDDMNHPARFPRGNRQPRTRSHQNSSRRRATSQVSLSDRMSQLRSHIASRTRPPIISSRGRGPQFPLDMDLDMRIDILEALEDSMGDFSDMGMVDGIFNARHDFNEADYEMLLALDEGNHQHTGASTNLINSLPQSTLQTNNFTEACAICLETPEKGETIRHLPCLHKFHKDCIDPWLRRKTSCPVCKSSIT